MNVFSNLISNLISNISIRYVFRTPREQNFPKAFNFKFLDSV